ncbi:CHAD domain-containing protein [Paenibacillus agricola]|uniref:CHAD domain-containing protein n=1 Tax=Paenibacillus agricola TaxID=2716264 RepID=A0ABX0J5V7_9BACL|nr:CHAD domain-containing protein [Paenibacillus agricola]NHN31792.1 CHAD domain-containing protein [Paenibacillus agricola]
MKIIRLTEVVQPSQKAQWEEALHALYTQFQSYSQKVLKRFDEEDIHQARVNSRKLLTLLRILDRDDQSGLFVIFKQAQKHLGKVRDADVLIEAFQERRKNMKKEAKNDERKGGRKKEAALLKSVIRIQKKKRRRSRGKLADQLPKLLQQSLDSKWKEYLAKQLEAQLAVTDANQAMRELEVAYEQKKQAYRQTGREHGVESGEAFEALHDLRIAAKELRYTASAAAFALDQKFHTHEKLYKEVQEQLGRINDRRVWLETVEAIGRKRLDVGRSTWTAFIDGLKAELHEELQLSKAVGHG